MNSLVALLDGRLHVGGVARFLLCVLAELDGAPVATQEVEVRSLSELPERYFEFAASFPTPTYGCGVPLDIDAESFIREVFERLPENLRALWRSRFGEWPSAGCVSYAARIVPH